MSNIMLHIMKDYEKIREKNKQELEKRKTQIYTQIPQMKEIDDSLVKLSIDITKAILKQADNVDELLFSLKKTQLDLKVEKAELLVSNKFPKNYLEMKYECNKCNDTGYIGENKCSCIVQKTIVHSYKQSNLGDQLDKENFDMFRMDYYSEVSEDGNPSPRDNIKDIYMKCIRFAKDFDSHTNNLFLIGRPGLGKTFLCNSIAKDLLDNGKSVIYQTAPDLIDLIRKYKFDFEAEDIHSAFLDELYHADLIIIDDLGTELTTQFSGLVIYNILNKRLLNNKKIIISTNLTVEDMTKIYSERIYSRIFGNFTMCKFYGDDIRFKKDKASERK